MNPADCVRRTTVRLTALAFVACIVIRPDTVVASGMDSADDSPRNPIGQERARWLNDDFKPAADPGLEYEGEIELRVEWLDNPALGETARDGERDGERDSEKELQLGLTYGSDRWAAHAEFSAVGDQTAFEDDRRTITDSALERGDMWLLFDHVGTDPLSFQIGRQNFFEPRLWWWDDDLDSVRVYYQGKSLRAWLGLAREIAPVSTDEDFIDPEDKDVRRLIGQVEWTAFGRLGLSAYLLDQHDGSGAAQVGEAVSTQCEDESDADLTWIGVRAIGPLSPRGSIAFRADLGYVYGDETVLEYGDDENGFSTVESRRTGKVRGWAVDTGVSWALPFRPRPVLRLSYARGSGDAGGDDGVDRNFRQTGLQDQDEDFRDYGVVLRPELSNIEVSTIALDVPVADQTTLTLGYHKFRQVEPSPTLASDTLDAEPTGDNADVGDEWSLALEVLRWENVEIEFIAGSFHAGRAFGDRAGERSERYFVKFVYDF